MAPFVVRKGLLITTIHLNLTTPCPDPGLACHLQGEQRSSRCSSRLGSYGTFAPYHLLGSEGREVSTALVSPVSGLPVSPGTH